MPQPRQIRKAAAMNEDVKAAIDEVANSLQVINVLSTRLRQDLGESAQDAIDLEGGAARARSVPFVSRAGKAAEADDSRRTNVEIQQAAET
jgi:hypothetical protein